MRHVAARGTSNGRYRTRPRSRDVAAWSCRWCRRRRRGLPVGCRALMPRILDPRPPSPTEVKMARQVEMELALEQAIRERRESSMEEAIHTWRESSSRTQRSPPADSESLPASSPRGVQEHSPRDSSVAALRSIDVASTAPAMSDADKELHRAEQRNHRLRVHARARSTERRRSPDRQVRPSPEERSVFRRGRSPERIKQQAAGGSGRDTIGRSTSASQRASAIAYSSRDAVASPPPQLELAVEPEYAVAADATRQRACKHGCGFVGSREVMPQHEHSCSKGPGSLSGQPVWSLLESTTLQTGPQSDGGSSDSSAALDRASSRQDARGSDVESGLDEVDVLTHNGRSPPALREKPLCGVLARCVLGSAMELADALIVLGHVIAYFAIYIGGSLCHGMHDPVCDEELSRATMWSAVLVCTGHLLLKLGARNDMAHFRLLTARQDQEYAKLNQQQQDDQQQHEQEREDEVAKQTVGCCRGDSGPNGIGCYSCLFRTCRVLGALLVIASLFLNVTLILVSNNEISMSFWEWLWN